MPGLIQPLPAGNFSNTVFTPLAPAVEGTYCDIFKAALNRILSTDTAKHTYAQIIDGLPTERNYHLFHAPSNLFPFPRDHQTVCPGAFRIYHLFKRRFDPLTLRFPQGLVKAFADTEEGTRPFDLRLIELLVIAVHELAVRFHSQPPCGEHTRGYELYEGDHCPDGVQGHAVPRMADFFWHKDYIEHEQYPAGVSDVVGYWAEASIFGGVGLFSRSMNGRENRNFHLHSCYRFGPRTIYPPTDEQFVNLHHFLHGTVPEGLGEDEEWIPEHAIPILPTYHNRWRVDPCHSMTQFQIYRDPWERTEPRGPRAPFGPVDRQAYIDWPEHIDHQIVQKMVETWEGNLEGMTPEAREIMNTAYNGCTQITPSSPLWDIYRAITQNDDDDD